MCGQIFLTGRISGWGGVGGDLLTGGFPFTPTCGIPTLSCKERPEREDSNKRQTAALATV